VCVCVYIYMYMNYVTVILLCPSAVRVDPFPPLLHISFNQHYRYGRTTTCRLEVRGVAGAWREASLGFLPSKRPPGQVSCCQLKSHCRQAPANTPTSKQHSWRAKTSPLPPSWWTIGCLHVRTVLKLFFLCHPKLNFVVSFSLITWFVTLSFLYIFKIASRNPSTLLVRLFHFFSTLLSKGRHPHTSRGQRTCNWVGCGDKKY